ncbi:MAG TPA: MerR family DNA-binding protein [Pyrinomonadaceae bacterium]|nr:MerR family DNA-binding protein [Pyrinomonadaceae bacterium]
MSQNSMITAMILARRNKVSLHTVRHYTRIGLLKPGRNQENDYKIYQPCDETRLRFICAVKECGFSLPEIAQILDVAEKKELSGLQVKEIVARRVAENRKKIEQIKKVQKKMESMLREWDSAKTGVPDGEAIYRLIESVSEIIDPKVDL